MSYTSFRAVNLTCTRGRQCLVKNFSFNLKAGESLYLKGENGSGKTSLLRLLAGLREPEEGGIYWGDKKIGLATETFRSNMLFLGHQNTLNPLLTPLENIKMSWGLEKNIILADSQIEEAFACLGFSLKALPCYTLSVGQRRRVALTRLVLSQAKLWLLDEPFTGLDKAGTKIVENLMSAHLNQGGMIVYSSHLEPKFNSYVYQL